MSDLVVGDNAAWTQRTITNKNHEVTFRSLPGLAVAAAAFATCGVGVASDRSIDGLFTIACVALDYFLMLFETTPRPEHMIIISNHSEEFGVLLINTIGTTQNT